MISPASMQIRDIFTLSFAGFDDGFNKHESSTTKLILLTSLQSSKDDWARARYSLIITKVTEQ